MLRRALIALSLVGTAAVVAACGSEGLSVRDQGAVGHGAVLFSQRCAGCHTLDVAGAQGGAQKVTDRERVDGPNFNVRKECLRNVLYAIENGGFSGAIMPENIVVGQDAKDVAAFLQKYSGTQAKVAAGSTKPGCTAAGESK
jgi:mono/diheme cytochrome c family protein